MAAPTNHDGHKHATDPLLDHLLNLWFRALGHDSQGVGVSYRPHRGSTQPRHTENRGDAPHGDQDEQVPMKTRSFHHLPLRFAHNQPGNSKTALEVLSLHSHEVIFTLYWCYLQCHSRSNLGLQEDEDEDEQRWYTAGEHHPDGESLFFSHRVDEPASGFGVGHLNTFWHNQFLKGDGIIYIYRTPKNHRKTNTRVAHRHPNKVFVYNYQMTVDDRPKAELWLIFLSILVLLLTFYWPTCPWIWHINQLNHKRNMNKFGFKFKFIYHQLWQNALEMEFCVFWTLGCNSGWKIRQQLKTLKCTSAS